MRNPARLSSSVLALSALLLGACATQPVPPPAAGPAKPQSPSVAATPAPPVVIEGKNFRYIERAINTIDSDKEAPYWLTGFNNSGRQRVLPTDNQGIALVLQAPVGVPKLVVEDLGERSDRIHLRIVNRGDFGFGIEVACVTRIPPYRRHAGVEMRIGANSIIDLALDTPSAERPNLLVRIR
jgi:hypothetical protein